MKGAVAPFAGILSCIFLLTACSEQPKQDLQKAEQAANQLAAERKAEKEKERLKRVIQPIDPKVLGEFLPPGTTEWPRGEISGALVPGGGQNTSKSQAEYGAAGHKIVLEIVDFADSKSKIEAAYWWVTKDIKPANQQLKDGYEKTDYCQKWYKTYERFNKEKNTCQYLVHAGGRYIVSATAENEDMAAVKALVDKMDFKKLAATK